MAATEREKVPPLYLHGKHLIDLLCEGQISK